MAQYCREVESSHDLDFLPSTRLQGIPKTQVYGLHVALVSVETGLGMQVDEPESLNALTERVPLEGNHRMRLDIVRKELLLFWHVIGLTNQNESPLTS